MAQYTIEDIEIIRQKSGISYEEAVNLLEYHNGSLARALVDLEKNGRLKNAKNTKSSAHRRGENVFTYLYRTRVKVTKGQITIVNLSALFMLFALVTAFWVPMIGLLVALLLLGYRISIERNSKEFSGDSFETIVRDAPQHVKSAVTSIAKDFENAVDPKNEPESTTPQKEDFHAESAASGTTPVNVQFPDGGSVEVKESMDGFHEADIQ